MDIGKGIRVRDYGGGEGGTEKEKKEEGRAGESETASSEKGQSGILGMNLFIERMWGFLFNF